MPTTLPVRQALRTRSVDMMDFARAIFSFYAGIAISIAILITIEYDLGMFNGLTLIDVVHMMTSTEPSYADPQLIGMF